MGSRNLTLLLSPVRLEAGNKADEWWDDPANILWQQQRLGEHRIFDAFRDDLIRLQKAGIPTKRGMMATKIGWNVENTMIDLLT